MYTCIYIDYLSTPPSSYLCVSTCPLKGFGVHAIVHWSAHPRALPCVRERDRRQEDAAA